MTGYRAQSVFGRWWVVLGTERIVEAPNKRACYAMVKALNAQEQDKQWTTGAS